jgi:hypothetical protein
LCAAEATSQELPETAMHSIEVQVVLEERTEAGIAERVLLDVKVPTPQLASGGLSFMIAESLGLGRLTSGVVPPEGYFNYTPLLVAEGTHHLGEPFLLPKPASADVGIRDVMGGLEGIGDLLGSDPPSEPAGQDPAEPPENDVVGLWLKLASIAPDGSRVETAAPVFDLLGFSARATGGVPDTPIPELVEVDGEYRDLAGIWDIGVLDGRFGNAAAAESAPGGGADAAATLAAGVRAVHANYDGLRRALLETAAPNAPRFLRLRVGISLLGWIPRPESTNRADYLMDVVLETAQPLPGADHKAAAAMRAASAVVAERLTVNAERLMLPLVDAADVAPFVALDVAALFDAAGDQGIALEVLSTSPSPGADDLSSEARARITAHLSAGRVLLAPAGSVALGSHAVMGWWVLDPATGLIVDEMENGRHQAMTEETVTTQPSRQAAPATRSLGQRMFCTLNRARALIGIMAALSGDPGGEQVMKDAISLESKIAEAADKKRRAGQSVSDPPGGCGAG